MQVERCDRCGSTLGTGLRQASNGEWRLCRRCRYDIEQKLDRLTVLEGFIEAVDRLARPIR